MTAWSQTPCLAFDVESTGVNAHEDRLVTAALVKLAPAAADPRVTTWLADPGVEISTEAEAIHGISTAHAVAKGQDIAQVLFEVTGQIAWALGRGIPLVAFNASYDLTLLEAENARHNIPTLADRLGAAGIRPIIDPYILDNRCFRKMTKAPTPENPEAKVCPCGCGAVDKKLVGACLHYGVPLGDDAHDAGADALAAGLLWPRILEEAAAHPPRNGDPFRGLTLAGLHQAQVGWRREQMDSLRKWFDEHGTIHDGCDPSWPLLSVPVAPAVTR